MLITNKTMTHLIERSNEESEIDNMIDFEMRKHLMKHKKTSSQHSPPSKQAINKPTGKEGPVHEVQLTDFSEPEIKESSEIMMLNDDEIDLRIKKQKSF